MIEKEIAYFDAVCEDFHCPAYLLVGLCTQVHLYAVIVFHKGSAPISQKFYDLV